MAKCFNCGKKIGAFEDSGIVNGNTSCMQCIKKSREATLQQIETEKWQEIERNRSELSEAKKSSEETERKFVLKKYLTLLSLPLIIILIIYGFKAENTSNLKKIEFQHSNLISSINYSKEAIARDDAAIKARGNLNGLFLPKPMELEQKQQMQSALEKNQEKQSYYRGEIDRLKKIDDNYQKAAYFFEFATAVLLLVAFKKCSYLWNRELIKRSVLFSNISLILVSAGLIITHTIAKYIPKSGSTTLLLAAIICGGINLFIILQKVKNKELSRYFFYMTNAFLVFCGSWTAYQGFSSFLKEYNQTQFFFGILIVFVSVVNSIYFNKVREKEV